MKAALLSAFVFPGLGHFYLKLPVRGMVLACAALASLVPVISSTMARAQQITDQILRGDIQPDITGITELLARQPADSGSPLLNSAYAVLIIVWLVGIADSYRAGRAQAGRRDRETNKNISAPLQ
ncbi:MAG: hypothetical protein WBO37_16330 [Gammaproteobacteria bacterium]